MTHETNHGGSFTDQQCFKAYRCVVVLGEMQHQKREEEEESVQHELTAALGTLNALHLLS